MNAPVDRPSPSIVDGDDSLRRAKPYSPEMASVGGVVGGEGRPWLVRTMMVAGAGRGYSAAFLSGAPDSPGNRGSNAAKWRSAKQHR